MANERAILCGGVSDADLPIPGAPLRLRLWGRHANAKLEINDISKALAASVPPAFADLLDIATYVYCADQAITRGGDGVENLGADWRRGLHFRIPVRVLDLWCSDRARTALTTTLGFLSEDEYNFDFVAWSDGPSLRDYLFGAEAETTGRFEEVVLFSGGLDSLGGAIREAIVDKRRVALITHQPSKKLVRRYRALKEELTSRAAHPPLFIPVTINKMKSLGREYTQRSRSFLYVALGATVAQMLGLSRVRFYENGVVSFNFPPSGQIVGARATRTTHPRVLRGFAEILSLVADRRFDVENPFLWKTKADIVRQIVDADCSDLIRLSTSCTHTWDMTKTHPHCGSCSQCIDRRFAVLAAGARDADPETSYKVKLLVDERDEGEPRTMLAAYVETASEVERMTPVDFFSKFGEASRVLRHIDGSPDAVALQVYELHKRHAGQITAVVDQAIADHSRAIRERSLPASCLLRLVCESAVPASGGNAIESRAQSEAPLPNYIFRKMGQAWQVRYAGGPEFVLLPTKGAAYLHLLIIQQGTPISATKLAATVALHATEHLLGDTQDAEGEQCADAGRRKFRGVARTQSDPDAMAAYRARYEELEAEIEEARANNDSWRASRIRGEMEDLGVQIRRDLSLGGKLRREADDRDKVRKAVLAALRRTVQEIGKYDKRLAEHLKPPVLRRGWSPCYSPHDPIAWMT